MLTSIAKSLIYINFEIVVIKKIDSFFVKEVSAYENSAYLLKSSVIGISPNWHIPQLAHTPTLHSIRLKSQSCRFTSLETRQIQKIAMGTRVPLIPTPDWKSNVLDFRDRVNFSNSVVRFLSIQS